jgi:hypothetical protein
MLLGAVQVENGIPSSFQILFIRALYLTMILQHLLKEVSNDIQVHFPTV